MTVKSGDQIDCHFVIGIDMGESVTVTEATLFGSAEGRSGFSMRLAYLNDCLNQISEELHPTWGKSGCTPRTHLERAVREIAHAMVALEWPAD
jgi:hypothetical protein